MCEPKLRTPGMARSSLLTWIVVRCSSASEVLGAAIQWIRKSRSLKVGNRDWPKAGVTTTPATTSTAEPA